MKILKILIVLVFSIFMTGCWQYIELNDIAIVTAVGIDKEGKEYHLSVQIVNAKKQTKDYSAAEESLVTVYDAKGKTLGEALNKISLESPFELYFGHIDMVVIGEATARLGIREYIDFLIRDRDVRKNYSLVVAKEKKAFDVLQILTPLETLPTINLINIIKTAQETSGYTSYRSFEDVLNCLYAKGKHPVVSVVEIIGDVEEGKKGDNIYETIPKTRLIAKYVGVFKGDKLVGFLKDKAALGLNILRKRVNNSVVSFPCNDQDDYGSVKMDAPKVSFKTKLKNNQPSAEIKIEFTATLTDYNCAINLKKSENIKKIEKMIDKEIKTIIEETMKETQKTYKTDVLGFGEYLYQNDYKNWGKIEKKWDQLFSNMPYKIEVKSKINNTGSTTNPVRQGGT